MKIYVAVSLEYLSFGVIHFRFQVEKLIDVRRIPKENVWRIMYV